MGFFIHIGEEENDNSHLWAHKWFFIQIGKKNDMTRNDIAQL